LPKLKGTLTRRRRGGGKSGNPTTLRISKRSGKVPHLDFSTKCLFPRPFHPQIVLHILNNIAWKIGSEDLDIRRIPQYAFDTRGEYDHISRLLSDYNSHDHSITPEWDAEFEALGKAQFRRHPVRCYVVLPIVRTLDMWFHPRTEALQLGTHGYDENARVYKGLAILFGAINVVLVIAAAIGLYRSRNARYLGVLWLFPLLRSAFLAIIGTCEQRYTIECIPFVLILAGQCIAMSRAGAYRGRVLSEREYCQPSESTASGA
jgi:hypothetical protein